MTSSVTTKVLGDCLLGLGRGQSPRYVERESPVRAINQKCIRNGTVDVTYARAHDPLGFVKEFALLQDGDVCINSTGTGTIGRIGLWAPFPGETDRFFADSHVTIIRPNNAVVNSGYLAALLQSPAVQTALETYCFSGSTNQVELNKSALSDLKLSVLSRNEQDMVAKVITGIDRVMQKTEALIVKQQRIRTGLMQDLLTKGIDEHGNIRSEATHSFKDSLLGRIPVEWDVSPAENLCEAVIDCKNRTPPEAAEGHPVIRTPNVRDGEFVSTGLAFTDSASYEIWTARGRPKAGDVVITREAPFGEACIIPEGLLAPCLGQRMMMYQPDPNMVRADYLVYAIYSQRVQQKLLELAGGSTVGHVRVGDIRALPIPHPVDVKEQEKITLVLNGVSTALKDKLSSQSKLASLRSGLMHDLLTGGRCVTPLFAQAVAQ